MSKEKKIVKSISVSKKMIKHCQLQKGTWESRSAYIESMYWRGVYAEAKIINGSQ